MKPQNILYNIPSWSMTVIVVLVITLMLLLPEPLPDDVYRINWFEGADKVVHGLMFAALGAAIIIDCRLSRRTSLWVRSHVFMALVIAVAAATVYGAFMECVQQLLDMGREGSWGDLAADAIGALVGAMTFSFIRI